MPFPRKVWIGLLCRAFTKQAIGLVHKQNRGSGKMIYLPSWGRYFRIGKQGFLCSHRGWDKETQTSFRKNQAWTEQEVVVFVCRALFYNEREARPERLRVDRTWRGMDGVCSLRCQGAGLRNSLGSSALPLPPPTRNSPTFHSAHLSYICPLLYQRSIRHLDDLWECLCHLHYIFPFFPHSTKGKREVGKICFLFIFLLSIQFPFLCILAPSSPWSCSLGTPIEWMKVI